MPISLTPVWNFPSKHLVNDGALPCIFKHLTGMFHCAVSDHTNSRKCSGTLGLSVGQGQATFEERALASAYDSDNVFSTLKAEYMEIGFIRRATGH